MIALIEMACRFDGCRCATLARVKRAGVYATELCVVGAIAPKLRGTLIGAKANRKRGFFKIDLLFKQLGGEDIGVS